MVLVQHFFLLKFIDYLATNSVGIKESFYFRAFVFKSEDSTISRGASDELATGNIVVVLDDCVLAVHHHNSGDKASTFLIVVWALIVYSGLSAVTTKGVDFTL
jgi:hypothetical protein